MIFLSVSDGVATINSHYNNTQDISFTFKKCTANELPDFYKFAFVDNPSDTVVNTIDAPAHYTNTSDCFAPYVVSALSNIDGDVDTEFGSQSVTGGNHVYSATDGSSILTAKNNYLRYYADGRLITSGYKYCSYVRIEWSNDVMAWNTVKYDGSGRYVLTEKFVMTYDGYVFHIEKIITSKETTIAIKSNHGLQFPLRYCNRSIGYAKFLGSDANKEQIPTDRRNYTSSHEESGTIYCDDKLCDAILIADDTNAVEFGLDPYGLGRNNHCIYERSTSGTISTAYVSTAKAYFNPIWYKTNYDGTAVPKGLELKKDESVYLKGYYKFYPYDSSNKTTMYQISLDLVGVQSSITNETCVSDKSEVYLYFSAQAGYDMPDSITVTGATKSYQISDDKKSASLLLINPTSSVYVKISGVASSSTSVPIRLFSSNLTEDVDNPSSISPNESVQLKFYSNSGYHLPTESSVSVTGAEYTWDDVNGILTLSNLSSSSVVSVAISGKVGEIWKIIDNPTEVTSLGTITLSVDYDSNGSSYNRFYASTTSATNRTSVKFGLYSSGSVNYTQVYYTNSGWVDESYRLITTDKAEGDFLVWLTQNAKKL